MRMMAILLSSAVFVYFITGVRGSLTKRVRFYFALGAFVVVYLLTMILVFVGGNS